MNERILLIRLKSIGDILFTGPAIHAVRAAFPEAKISYLTSKQNAALLQGYPEVGQPIALDKAPFRKGNPKGLVLETLALLRQLQRGRFSLVIDFQGYGETALLTRLSFAPERWGSLYKRSRRWAYTRAIARNNRIHPAEAHLCFLEECGVPRGKVVNEFVLPETALEEARRRFLASGLNPAAPTLFLQPFTSTPEKNWPLDWYLAVARHWRERGVQILFGGGPADDVALQPVREAGFPAAAEPSLLVSAGLMKLSSIILGGDTGMLHAAVAMSKRVVMLMARVAPGSCHPFQHPDWAVAPPAGRAFSPSKIEVPVVIDACVRAFSDAKVDLPRPLGGG